MFGKVVKPQVSLAVATAPRYRLVHPNNASTAPA
jgi:hypothetical protein